MANNLRCYAQIKEYLTPEAVALKDRFMDIGVADEDLAITLVETCLSDEEMYDLPEPKART